jgi:hypothetical protein
MNEASLDDARTAWRKSSYSNAQANCVEIAVSAKAVGVRDSKDQEGPELTFPAAAWSAFTESIKDGSL